MPERLYTAIGLMSGTSLDGIDAALLRTNGTSVVEPGPWISLAYDDSLREALRQLLGATEPSEASAVVERELTDQHASIVLSLLEKNDISISKIDIIGLHGHTVFHDPDRSITWQLGDGHRLASKLRRDVVADFRRADVLAGGEGAPLAPLYHQTLAAELPKPLAVLNLGGVANVTWIGSDRLLAFDTGPGNAMIDDWVLRHKRGRYDVDGAFAAAGAASPQVLSGLLASPYFRRPPPKSLDRLQFGLADLEGLSFEDGAATLAGFTVGAVMAAREHFPQEPRRWLVTGGGRHNSHLMDLLARGLGVPVDSIESEGWNGDALEAQAFAYLAVRSLLDLPLSLPTTTGVAKPTPGGRLFRGTDD